MFPKKATVKAPFVRNNPPEGEEKRSFCIVMKCEGMIKVLQHIKMKRS